MGVSIYSQLSVGFVVTRADFFIEVPDTQATCQKGHAQGADKPAFCAQDGTKFTFQVKDLPSPAFIALAEMLGETPKNGDWQDLYYALQGDRIIAVDASTDGDDPTTQIFGEKILRTGDAMEGGGRRLFSKDLQQVQEAFNKATQYAQAFGGREVRMYLNAYVSC